jgi:hypothetical protein
MSQKGTKLSRKTYMSNTGERLRALARPFRIARACHIAAETEHVTGRDVVASSLHLSRAEKRVGAEQPCTYPKKRGCMWLRPARRAPRLAQADVLQTCYRGVLLLRNAKPMLAAQCSAMRAKRLAEGHSRVPCNEGIIQSCGAASEVFMR